MAVYSAILTRTLSRTNGVGRITAGAARIRICDVIYSMTGTPPVGGRVSWRLRLAPNSDGSSGTAVTPFVFDSADAASLATIERQLTANPTNLVADSVLSADVRGRSTFRWFAAEGHEIILPASGGTAAVMTPQVGTLVGGVATVAWKELGA